MKEKIQLAASQLMGMPLWDAGRAADLAWFAFGERRLAHDFRGQPREVGEFALHVQCAWRIVRGETVLVGHRDLYYPAGAGTESREVPANFHWDVQGANRMDGRLKRLFQNPPEKLNVSGVEAGLAGALQIFFQNEMALEIFPNDSFDEEHWRLFRPYLDEPHFIVKGSSVSSD